MDRGQDDMEDRRDTAQAGCKTEGMQEGMMQDMMKAGQE